MIDRELAQRAVNTASFRWTVGMRGVMPDGGKFRVVDGDGLPDELVRSGRNVPDLDDPATQGCILALLREGRYVTPWLDADAPVAAIDACMGFGEDMTVRVWGLAVGYRGAVAGPSMTYAEALVAALEAAEE